MTPFRAAKQSIAPALGLLELGGIARGMVAADAMVKKAPVELLGAHAVNPGKFVVLVAGGVEEGEQATDVSKLSKSDRIVEAPWTHSPPNTTTDCRAASCRRR